MKMGKNIFIVDDEPDICDLVSLHLEKNGFKTRSFYTALEFLNALKKQIPDLVILDLMLPDLDGLEVCKALRTEIKTANLPIIMLTAKGEEMDKILGLELGADDYVTKPFSPRELVARVKAILRRIHKKEQKDLIKIRDLLVVDTNKFEVLVKGKKIQLTTTEFKILKTLVQKAGWVFTREQLLEVLWGREKAVLDRTVDVHIKNLREKLGKAGMLIKSIRGVGYKIDP